MYMKDFWNPQRVEDRAKSMRAEAEADKRIADIRIQFAVTLEDIANAWEKDRVKETKGEDEPQSWLMWGSKVKCPYCGAVQDTSTNECHKCGKRCVHIR